MDRACSTHGEKGDAYTLLMGNPEGSRELVIPRYKRLDNNKLDLRVIEWSGMDWVDLAQDRDRWRALVNMVTNLRVP
jgi:hypothetical protein